jgi:hypothetical protein
VLIHAPLGNVPNGEACLIVIGDLHEFKRVFRRSGLCGRASPKLYSVDNSFLILVETFDYPCLPGLDHLDYVIVGKFSRCAHGHEVYQRITARAERFGAAASPDKILLLSLKHRSTVALSCVRWQPLNRGAGTGRQGHGVVREIRLGEDRSLPVEPGFDARHLRHYWSLRSASRAQKYLPSGHRISAGVSIRVHPQFSKLCFFRARVLRLLLSKSLQGRCTRLHFSAALAKLFGSSIQLLVLRFPTFE